jgi:hypothetical protein
VRLVRGGWRAAVFLADVVARAGPRADFAAVLALRGLVTLLALFALPALLALLALPALLALLALPALLAFAARLAFAALRVRATAAVFFRAALFLAVLRARDFARIDLFFLVAAALRLAIALVLSAAGLP